MKDWILLVYAVMGMILYFGNPLHGAWGTNAYSILSLILLMISFAAIIKEMSKSIKDAWDKSVLGQFIELVKKFL